MGLEVDAQACSGWPNRREGRIHAQAAALLARANVAGRTSPQPVMQGITQEGWSSQLEGPYTGRTWNRCA